MSILLLFCALIVAGAVVIVLASQADRRLDETLGDALDDDPAAFRNNVRRIDRVELRDASLSLDAESNAWGASPVIVPDRYEHDLGPACALCGVNHNPASAS